MKQLLLFPLLSIGVLHANDQMLNTKNIWAINYLKPGVPATNNFQLDLLQKEGTSRMAASVFKAQEFCRAELKDFDFDIHYSIVSAVVYFSGANFKNAEKGAINSSSLKTIKSQMERCIPGSVVIFDEIKVKGPDNTLRTIQGASFLLY